MTKMQTEVFQNKLRSKDTCPSSRLRAGRTGWGVGGIRLSSRESRGRLGQEDEDGSEK